MAIDPTAPVTAILNGTMNAKQAREEQKRAHGYNKEYMALSHMYEMASARKSAQMTKQGLVAAGLSPALMSQGMFAPATAPTGPSAPSPAPSRFDMKSLGIGDMFQLQNLQAQTENIKANTEKTKLENERTEDENSTAQGLAIMQLEKMSADLPDSAVEEKARLQALADLVKNRGSLVALNEYAGMLDKSESYNSRAIQNRLQKVVVDYQLNRTTSDGHSIIADIAELPSAQFAQLWASQMQLLRHAEWLEKQKGLTEEERLLKLEQTKLTKEEIENLKEVTKNLKNTNIMKMVDDGEYGKALLASLILVLGNLGGSASVSKKF